MQPAPSPTYDPHEHNLTPTITPPAKDHGTTPPATTPDPNSQFNYIANVTYGPPASPKEHVQNFGLFVTGRVVEILPAQWTTPDGQRPENPFEINPEEIQIITPVVIELEGMPLVNRLGADLSSSQEVIVAAYGGQVGEDRFETNDSSQQFEVGERVLLGLTNHPYLQGDVERRFQTPVGLAWNVGTKYILTEDGMAVSPNPNEGIIPAAELIAAIAAAGIGR